MKKQLSKILFAAIVMAFATSYVNANNGFNSLWEARVDYHDNNTAPIINVFSNHAQSNVAFLNPLGIEVYHKNEGKKIADIECKPIRSSRSRGNLGLGRSSSRGITIGGGRGDREETTLSDELNSLQKVVYIPVPHLDGVLRFDYRESNNEVISFIDLKTGKENWQNNELKWSMENAKELLSVLGRVASNQSSLPVEVPEYPEYFVKNMIKILPGQNAMLVNSFFGLAYMDLSSGEIKWTVEETSLGLSHIIFDEQSGHILTFGGNPVWLPTLPGLENIYQMSKDILRINSKTGSIIWKSNYSKNYRVKKPGGFNHLTAMPDIRLENGLIVLNFNQIEIFDFETGKAIFETTSGQDALTGFMGYGPASEFALPVIEDGYLYRYVITGVLALGASVGDRQVNNFRAVVEAYHLESGELRWTSTDFTRQKVNNLSVRDGLVLLSFDGREGIKALQAETGELVWEAAMGRRGVTTNWIIHENHIVAAENDEIHIIDIQTGNTVNKINAGRSNGSVKELRLYNNQILAIGERRGLVLYDIENGDLIASANTGFNADVWLENNLLIVFPDSPSDPFMVLHAENLSELGTISSSRRRTGISWCGDSNIVYTIRSNRIEAFHFAWTN